MAKGGIDALHAEADPAAALGIAGMMLSAKEFGDHPGHSSLGCINPLLCVEHAPEKLVVRSCDQEDTGTQRGEHAGSCR